MALSRNLKRQRTPAFEPKQPRPARVITHFIFAFGALRSGVPALFASPDAGYGPRKLRPGCYVFLHVLASPNRAIVMRAIVMRAIAMRVIATMPIQTSAIF